MDERQIRCWSDWWVNEVLRQSLPTPQLLYFDSYPGRPCKFDSRIGSLWAPEEFKILYLYPLSFPDNGDSHQYQTNTDWLNTEAFVMPSTLGIQNYYSCYEARRMNQRVPHHSYARLNLSLFQWDMPTFGVRLPEEYAETFSWMKHMRAPATIRSTTFSEAQVEDREVNTPKEFSEHGEFTFWDKWRLNYRRNNPFFFIGPND